jgi:hypothetical protein
MEVNMIRPPPWIKLGRMSLGVVAALGLSLGLGLATQAPVHARQASAPTHQQMNHNAGGGPQIRGDANDNQQDGNDQGNGHAYGRRCDPDQGNGDDQHGNDYHGHRPGCPGGDGQGDS